MLSVKNQEKCNKIKSILDDKNIIYEEKANGQLNVDKISYWTTTDKWYDPVTGARGLGINSFIMYFWEKNKKHNTTTPQTIQDEVEFTPETYVYETKSDTGEVYKFVEKDDKVTLYVNNELIGVISSSLHNLYIMQLLKDIRKLKNN